MFKELRSSGVLNSYAPPKRQTELGSVNKAKQKKLKWENGENGSFNIKKVKM